MRILFLIAILPLAMAYWGPKAKVCKDTYAHCDRRTHCPRYQNACKETCGLCRSTRKPHIPFPLEPRPHTRCEDSYGHCNKRIHCPRYKDACKKTCGLCRRARKPHLPFPLEPKPQCHDDLPHCADWNVDCKVYGDGCKKTCGLCDHGHKDDHDTRCKDYYPDCPEIASNNWCPIYKEKCCKSCKKAEKQEDPRCKDEASGCRRHKPFMCKNYPQKCKKTCGLCNGGFGFGHGGFVLLGAGDQPEEQPPSECVDYWADDCPTIAQNNWCNVPSYKGKCCKSCKAFEENKGDCYDETGGCVADKKRMCKMYPNECKKTCGLC